MVDTFEARLAAMFEDAQEGQDTSAFLLAVDAKIEARRASRRLVGMIVATGAALTAATGIAATGLSQPFADLLVSAGPRIGALLPPLGAPMLQTEIGWTVLGLGVLAIAAGASRLFEHA